MNTLLLPSTSDRSNGQLRVLVVTEHDAFRREICLATAGDPAVHVIENTGDLDSAVQMISDLCPDVVVLSATEIGTHERFMPELMRACPDVHLLVVGDKAPAADHETPQLVRSTPHLLHVLAMYGANVATDRKLRVATLTLREREVLQLVADGLSSKQIADQLDISVRTVESHRNQIMNKLNERSIAGLTKYAIRQGLTTL